MQRLNYLEIQQVSGGIATVSIMAGYVLGSKDWDPFYAAAFAASIGFMCFLPLGAVGYPGLIKSALIANALSDVIGATAGYVLSQVD